MTATEATGASTVTCAVPFFPSAVAVIVAGPAATAVTRPLPSTVATAGALVVHVTLRPESGVPAASLSVAVSATAPPARTVGALGATATDATGARTVTSAEPAFPSLVAEMVAAPAATAVTSPLLSTVAAAALLELQVTARPFS